MKTINNIAAVLAVALFSTSCNDVLDIENTKQFGDEIVWSSEELADSYVISAYNTIADRSNNSSTNRHFEDCYTDLFKSTSWDQYDHMYNKSLMLTTQYGKNNAGDFASWGSAYSRIKRTNIIINDIEAKGAKFGEDYVKVRRAEMRFCNAINYWFIARVYGGAVIRTPYSGVNGGTDDGKYEADRNRARVSEKETYDYIISEMRGAIEDLPEKWESNYTGRATKGMACGFLSRIALYAKRWDVAANAADSCKLLGDYGLVADYKQLFDNNYDASNRKEVIYAIYNKRGVRTNKFDKEMRPFGDRKVYNTVTEARIVPTAELADMYEFKDGSEFDWKTWKSKGHADPFTDREPRFHATILYNGAKWEGRTIETFVGSNSTITPGADSYVEYKNATSTGGHTCTGYYLRKYLQEGNAEFHTYESWNTENILRYAEVLLNKAEALAELGDIDKALVPLNEVRARVGLPAKTLTDAPDKDAFMKILRKERVCELAGEGLRIWDLRRWKIAHEVIDGQTVHGVKILRSSSGKLTYTTVDADDSTPRIFQDRYYYFSIPADELTNNKLCEDNPGW